MLHTANYIFHGLLRLEGDGTRYHHHGGHGLLALWVCASGAVVCNQTFDIGIPTSLGLLPCIMCHLHNYMAGGKVGGCGYRVSHPLSLVIGLWVTLARARRK